MRHHYSQERKLPQIWLEFNVTQQELYPYSEKLFRLFKKMMGNPTALRKANIVCNFGLSECSRVKEIHKVNQKVVPL